MKNCFLLSLIITLVVSNNNLFGQSTWSQTYPASLSIDEEIKDIASISGDGFVGIGSVVADAQGNHDVLLMRCNSVGDLLWSKQFNGGSNETGESIDLFPNGGYVFASTKANPSLTLTEILISRTDNSGNIIWSKKYAGNGNDIVNQLSVLDNGNIIVAGSTTLCPTAFSCGHGMLLDSNGVILWNRSFEKESGNYFLDVIETSDGGFLFSGATLDIFTGQNGWAVKTDSAGSLTWSNAFDAFSLDVFFKATENVSSQNFAFVGETTPDAVSTSDALLVVCDYNGNYIISGSAGGPENDRGNGIHAGFAGTYIMTGLTEIDTLFQNFTQGLSLEVDISTGNISNAVTIGNRMSNTFVTSSAIDAQGMILLGGYGNQFNASKYQTFAIRKNGLPNSVCFETGVTQLTTIQGHADNFIAATDTITFSVTNLGFNIIPLAQVDSIVCGTTFIVENSTNPEVTLYPNPSTGKFHLNGISGENISMVVYDKMGRIVCSKSNISSDTIIEITNQSTGIYLIQITGNNFNQALRFTLIND